MIRVIAGEFRGRRLKMPKRPGFRATLDRVKESIFNVLGADVVDRAVLDLFCGTGALGIEALSRGARSAVFVDLDQGILQIARENVIALGLQARATFVAIDALQLDLEQLGHSPDLVFADPPYEMQVGSLVCHLLVQKRILAMGGLLVYEHYRREAIDEPALRHLRRLEFGQTVVDFFIREENR